MTEPKKRLNVTDGPRTGERPLPGKRARVTVVHGNPDAKVSIKLLGDWLVPGLGRWTVVPGALVFTATDPMNTEDIPPMPYSYELNGVIHTGDLTLVA